MLFRQYHNRLRNFWNIVKFHIHCADYAASYQGNPDQCSDASSGTVIARVSGYCSINARLPKESCLKWMIYPLANTQQEQAGADGKGSEIVAKIDLRNYSSQRYHCPKCGASLVPVIDFETFQGIFHIHSLSIEQVPSTNISIKQSEVNTEKHK